MYLRLYTLYIWYCVSSFRGRKGNIFMLTALTILFYIYSSVDAGRASLCPRKSHQLYFWHVPVSHSVWGYNLVEPRLTLQESAVLIAEHSRFFRCPEKKKKESLLGWFARMVWMMFWVSSTPVCSNVVDSDKESDQSFAFISAEKKVFLEWMMISHNCYSLKYPQCDWLTALFQLLLFSTNYLLTDLFPPLQLSVFWRDKIILIVPNSNTRFACMIGFEYWHIVMDWKCF